MLKRFFSAVVLVAPLVVGGVELKEVSRRAIRESEFPMNFCHAKAFPDGTVYLGHTIGCHMRGERGAAIFSPDFGRTWTTNGLQVGGMNAYLTTDGRKRFVTGWEPAERQVHTPTVKTIEKDGSVTETAGRIDFPKPTGMCLYRDVLRLRDGSLLLCGYTPDRSVPTQRKGFKTGYTAYLLKSEDEGLSWRFLSYLPACADAQEGQTESSVAELKDGSIVRFVRTGNAMYPDQPGERGLRQYVSHDGGLTWDGGRRVADYGVEPQTGLLSDGTLFVLSGRPGVYLLLDPTGTGDHFERFEVFDGMGSASSTLYERAPGRLSIIYDDSQYSQWPCRNATNRIMQVDYEYAAQKPSGGASSWERPRTTRRYLHPPCAERLFVLFSDAKLTFAEVFHDLDWQKRRYPTVETDACWLLRDGRPFDFRTAACSQPTDGVPVHSLSWATNGVTETLTACCDYSRQATAFGRLDVVNRGSDRLTRQYALSVRNGLEWVVLGNDRMLYAPDFYGPYSSCLDTWLAQTCDWTFDGTRLVSPRGGFIAFASLPPQAKWDAKAGALTFDVSLGAGESVRVDFSVGFGKPVAPTFDATCRETARRWREELAKIDRLPPSLAADAERLRLIRNLTVQILQCFSRPVGRDYLLPRQGGLQRWAWPWDNMEALDALSRIGSFDDYVEGAISFYFDLYGNVYDGAEAGRIGPFGYDWDCNTANVLSILGRYCRPADKRAVWERYRARALEGFRWVMRHRVQKGAGGTLVEGLFPPGRASDYEGAAQVWDMTDGENLRALSHYVNAATRFDDPALAEIRAGFDDYVAAMRRVVVRFGAAYEGKDELYLPLTPDGTDGSKLRKGYPRTGASRLAVVGPRCGFLEDADILRLWNWDVRHGKISPRGLTTNFPPYDNLESPHYWYTTSGESLWQEAFLRIGRKDLADFVLEGALRYSMTAEYYVGERYRDDNPWYLPWSPNCSGSGRIIRMLLRDAAHTEGNLRRGTSGGRDGQTQRKGESGK